MKLISVGFCVLATALPLRAQNLFIVTEDSGRYPVKAVEDHRPIIVVNGVRRQSNGLRYSLARAPIFGLGVVDVSAFKVEVTNSYSGTGFPQLHVYGRLKADTPLQNCFFVVRLSTDSGKSVIYDALPDLAPDRDTRYETFFNLPIHNLPGAGHFNLLVFSNGLQLTTSVMSPEFIARQRSQTLAYLQNHPSH